jgi:SAM-dependent methyltransferase
MSSSQSDNLEEKIFNKLYSDFSLLETIEESRKERVIKRLSGSSYVYGEITFEGFKQIYDFAEKEFGKDYMSNLDSFVDLGSGSGKVCLASAILGNFKKSVGVELLGNLTALSDSIKDLYEFMIKNNDEDLIHIKKNKNFTKLEFINDDLLNYDFSKDNVVFTNSTCWGEEMLKKISLKAEKMNKDNIIINTDQQLFLNSKNWLKLKPINVKMSWGMARTFISKRL